MRSLRSLGPVALATSLGDAKSRGLNLEDRRLTDPSKPGLLLSLVALALGRAGRAAADVPGRHAPPPRKIHGHHARSWLRTGFDPTRVRLGSNPLDAIELTRAGFAGGSNS